MNKHIRLPRFVSPQNPFASDKPSKTPPASAATVETAVTAPKTEQALPPAPATPESVQRTAGLGRAVRTLKEWSGTANLFTRLARRPGPVRSAGISVTNTPTQGELRLDTVQVVRNDLSDADLEVVPAGKAVVTKESVPILAASEHGPNASAWDWFTTRVFARGQRQ